MPHKFAPDGRARLTSEDRRKRLPPEEILGQIGLKEGDTLVDIGAGTGLFTLPAARIVGPGGRVFGLDISREMVDDLSRAAATEGLANIEAVVSEETEARLPREAEFYFMVNVFHELDDRAGYLDRIRDRMGPRSRLVIVDYRRKTTPHGPPLADRVDADEARALCEAHGLTVLRVWDVNDEEYGLIAGPAPQP
jgi:ubiquinone/menaquinone biosynthesis C-methylase UbiE